MRSLAAILLLSACSADVADTPRPVGGDDTAAVLPTDMSPPPFTVAANHPILGGQVTVSIAGANAGESVYILRSPAGTGNPGQCFAQAGGRCSNLNAPVALQTSIVANGSGSGTRTVSFPNTRAYDGVDICFQAAIIRGAGGASSVFSNTVCQEAGYDSDDDGIIDALDQCPGFDDYFDWDMDGVSDGCDAVADQPPVFPNATPVVNIRKGTFQGRDVQWFIPANPVGLVFLFHGTGGNATVAEAPETIVMLNELISRGYGIVALTSENRNSKQWDLASRPSQNPDWNRVTAWRTSKINSGEIAANTPLYAWGFSNGGGFVGWMSNAAPAAGLPLRAGVVQSSSSYNNFYGAAGDLPMLFISARWDIEVLPADIQSRYNDHIASGYIGEYRQIPEQRLAPTRFDRSDFINLNKSLELFKFVVDDGWFDKGGHRLFPGPDLAGTIDTIGALPGFSPSAPGKAMLSAALATHAVNGYYTEQIANFLDRY